MQYKIIAYDDFGNPSVEENNGEHFVYIVVPEFQGPAIVIIIIIATPVAAIFARKNPKTQRQKQPANRFPE